MRRRIFSLMAAAAFVGLSVPVVGHHAVQAEFDMSKTGKFTGVLTRFANINPHPRWFFDVKKPDGTIEKWEISAGGGRSRVRDLGLLREFKPGQTFTVTYAPQWSGAKVGRVRVFTFPDGREITIFHADADNPFDN